MPGLWMQSGGLFLICIKAFSALLQGMKEVDQEAYLTQRCLLHIPNKKLYTQNRLLNSGVSTAVKRKIWNRSTHHQYSTRGGPSLITVYSQFRRDEVSTTLFPRRKDKGNPCPSSCRIIRMVTSVAFRNTTPLNCLASVDVKPNGHHHHQKPK